MLPRTVIVGLVSVAIAVASPLASTLAQDTVPYAYRPLSGDTYVPTLGDIMGGTQLRHFKLWYAGKLKNWDLAAYELGQIWDSFTVSARLYTNIPIEKINMIDQPLKALDSAIKAKDSARFDSVFDSLTSSCNSCHEAAHVGFVSIQIPTASPFSNQSFVPKGH
jgi:hypothetical protein